MTRPISPYKALRDVIMAAETGAFVTSDPPADSAGRLPVVWLQIPTGVPVANAAGAAGQIWTVAIVTAAETNSAASELAWDVMDALVQAPSLGHLSESHAAIASVTVQSLPFRPPASDLVAQDIRQYNQLITVRTAV
ncbi:hypothetical protein [Kocuria sp.]|uniref:hypothetical protein n=1 Tax=Kocuria sp. TaxID=1871328 RepID=UPI0026DEB90D|nr:hypothetical protein [Kocuria sp.]MDO5619272.1 hypothetical protein [Kocuria sp.]